MKHPESWKILCMLINVDSEYKILSERLRVLEKLFDEEKVHSLIFYLEAFKCYREKSSSLKKLGMFEVRVLSFAANITDDKRIGALHGEPGKPAETL